MLTDEQFTEKLREYLAQWSEGHEPIVPIMYNNLEDKIIEREKTLELPCYEKLDKTGLNV